MALLAGAVLWHMGVVEGLDACPLTLPPPLDSHQGTDQSPKPLIIGPEEDYDPGYFNNEVTVSWFSPFVMVTPAVVE